MNFEILIVKAFSCGLRTLTNDLFLQFSLLNCLYCCHKQQIFSRFLFKFILVHSQSMLLQLIHFLLIIETVYKCTNFVSFDSLYQKTITSKNCVEFVYCFNVNIPFMSVDKYSAYSNLKCHVQPSVTSERVSQ